jgi:hypothetical protein
MYDISFDSDYFSLKELTLLIGIFNLDITIINVVQEE